MAAARLLPSLFCRTCPRLPLLRPPLAVARTNYDGNWSVLIVTKSGPCDAAYRYGLSIRNGRSSTKAARPSMCGAGSAEPARST